MARSGLYVPLDVNFNDDDKIAAVSPEAELVYIRSLLLSKRTNSDGRIRPSQVRRLLEKWSLHDVAEDELLAELVRVDLWREVGDGWVITAWAGHNLTTSELDERRAKDAERKRAARSERTKPASENVRADADARPSVSSADSEEKRSDSEEKNSSTPDGFEAFWVRYPRRNGERAGKAKARDLWAKLTPELRDAAGAGLDAYARAKGEFPEDCERYIRHRRWEGLDDEPVIDTPTVHRPTIHVADETPGEWALGLEQLRAIRVGRAI